MNEDDIKYSTVVVRPVIVDKLEKLESYIFGHKLGEKNLSNRVQDLESYITGHEQEILDLQTNLARLEIVQEKLSQDNDNPHHVLKMHERIDFVLNRMNKLDQFICDKLLDIEKDHLNKLSTEAFVTLSDRLTDLECKLNSINFLSDLINRSIKVFQDSDGLKPHRCPNCEGEGKNKNKLVIDDFKEPCNIIMKNPECISCEGKGILWA